MGDDSYKKMMIARAARILRVVLAHIFIAIALILSHASLKVISSTSFRSEYAIMISQEKKTAYRTAPGELVSCRCKPKAQTVWPLTVGNVASEAAIVSEWVSSQIRSSLDRKAHGGQNRSGNKCLRAGRPGGRGRDAR